MYIRYEQNKYINIRYIVFKYIKFVEIEYAVEIIV